MELHMINKYMNACSIGDVDTIRHMLKRNNTYKTTKLLVKYMNKACEKGHLNVVNVLLQHKIIYNSHTLFFAAKGGNMEILKTISTICSRSSEEHSNIQCSRILGACLGGHIDIVKFYTNITTSTTYWDIYLRYASMSGNKSLVSYITSKGTTKVQLPDSMFTSSLIGDMNGINTLIENGSVNCSNCVWEYGLKGACMGGYLDIVKFMINKGANNLETGLSCACEYDRLEIAKFMIEMGATNFNYSMKSACRAGKIELVKLMIEHGADNWDDCLAITISYNNNNNNNNENNAEIVELMISHGATFTSEMFVNVCHNGDVKVAKFLIETWKNINRYFNRNINQGLCTHLRNQSNLYYMMPMTKHGSTNFSQKVISGYNDNTEVIKLLFRNGANNYAILEHVEDFQLYMLYCKFRRINPSKDRCIKLLLEYPAYQLFVISRTVGNGYSCLKRLPVELFRLLFTFDRYIIH